MAIKFDKVNNDETLNGTCTCGCFHRLAQVSSKNMIEYTLKSIINQFVISIYLTSK